MAVLITGMSFAGKSFAADVLAERDFLTLDVDDANVGQWVNVHSRKVVKWAEGMDYSEHIFLWSPYAIAKNERFAKAEVICGISENCSLLYPYVSKVIVVRPDRSVVEQEAVMEQLLKARKNPFNPFKEVKSYWELEHKFAESLMHPKKATIVNKFDESFAGDLVDELNKSDHDWAPLDVARIGRELAWNWINVTESAKRMYKGENQPSGSALQI